MSTWIIEPKRGIIEPVAAPEYFISDCSAAELITGGYVRFYLTAAQLPLDAGSVEPQHVVTMKMIRSIASLPVTIEQLGHCIEFANRAPVPPGRHKPLRIIS